jgi:hypothetical protein
MDNGSLSNLSSGLKKQNEMKEMNTEIVNHTLKGRIVLALRSFKKGELVTVSKPVGIAAKRDRHSIQLKEAFHIYLDEPGAIFSHSCHWNLGIADNEYGGINFYASRDIECGEELSFFYGMTEAESIAVPDCKCGYAHCLGRSYGFKEATADLQAALYEAGIAAYLQVWYNEKKNRETFDPSSAR